MSFKSKSELGMQVTKPVLFSAAREGLQN